MNSPTLKTLVNYLSGEASIKALGIISIPIITRILSPTEYGLLAIYNSLIALLIIFVPLNLQVSLRPRYLKHPENFSLYLGTVTIASLSIGLVICILISFFSGNISGFLKIPNKLLLIAVIAAFLSILKELFFRVVLGRNDSKKYARYNFSFNFSDIVLTILIILILSSEKYYGKAYANLIVIILFLLFSLLKLRSHIQWMFNWNLFKHAILYSTPLIIHATSHFILAQFDKLIINQLINSESTGYYALAYSTSSLLMVIITAVNHSWVPLLFSAIKNGDLRPILPKLKFLSILVIISGFLLALFGNEIIAILAPEEYYSAAKLIPVLVLGNIFIYLYMIYSNYSFYSGKTILIALNTLLSGTANVILNYVFIPKYGIHAAAYTTLASYVLLFCLHYLSANFFHKDLPKIKASPILITICIFTIAYFLVSLILLRLNTSLQLLMKITISLIIITLVAIRYKSIFIKNSNNQSE